MKTNKSFSLGSRKQSLVYALKGIRHLLKKEPNAFIHLLATIVVIAAGIITGLGRGDWLAITIAIALVWLAEGFNTCIELLCDLYCENQYNHTVGIIKDISAGVVLIAALTSIVIGIIVFFF
jgi:diacylglycerol kinase (ATP)